MVRGQVTVRGAGAISSRRQLNDVTSSELERQTLRECRHAIASFQVKCVLPEACSPLLSATLLRETCPRACPTLAGSSSLPLEHRGENATSHVTAHSVAWYACKAQLFMSMEVEHEELCHYGISPEEDMSNHGMPSQSYHTAIQCHSVMERNEEGY